MTTTKADDLAACATRRADLTAQQETVTEGAKDLERRISELRATRARAAADGDPIPDRASLTVLEAELRDAQDLAAEIAERLTVAERDHRTAERESWREEAAALRAQAASRQAELDAVIAQVDVLQRRRGSLGGELERLLAQAAQRERDADARGRELSRGR